MHLSHFCQKECYLEHILLDWNRKAEILKKKDLRLAFVIQTIGKPTLEFESNLFRSLVESILSQQLAPTAARTIIQRVRCLNPPFPTASYIRQCRVTRLRKAGVSGQKSGYLKSLAEHWENRQWRSGWKTLADDKLIERLTSVKGIGIWTAQMFLIFSFGRTNVLPVLDYGIRRGIQILYSLPNVPHPNEVPTLVGHWEGAYSVASWYLWQGLDRKILR